ncbi:MAG: nucleoside hydrolase, partial [Desulfovibrio sp.]|nr:nucleoside hydrolase [Desulfovibrio sp.]
GNVTPAAEFNWWFDPEAAQIAVRSPFKEQIMIGLDVCEKVVFRKEHYDRLVKTLGNSEQAKLLRSSFAGGMFEKDATFTFFVWDVLVSAVIIDPTLITKEVTNYIDVNTDFGISYGQSLAYPKLAPKGAQKARIVTEVDEKRFWDLLNDTTYWVSARQVPTK